MKNQEKLLSELTTIIHDAKLMIKNIKKPNTPAPDMEILKNSKMQTILHRLENKHTNKQVEISMKRYS